jgi:dipeptidyl aminopeptidase/acylaminoacyl peptidase
MIRVPAFAVLTLAFAAPILAQAPAQERRPFTAEDLHALKDVSDPQISPDGGWIAYTVSTDDVADDRQVSDLWMTSWDGKTTIRLTSTPKVSEHTPRWSPDGRFLAFLSSRGDSAEADQLWLLSRRGGEAELATQVKEGIDDYAWSPDGTRLVFVIGDGDSVEVSTVVDSPLLEVTDLEGKATPQAAAKKPGATDPPIVIDRYYFKEDYTGYVRRKRKHLYLFDPATKNLRQLTQGRLSRSG